MPDPSPNISDANTRPILTLAIPTYNRAPQLLQLLGSLLAQVDSLPLVELLVADNASTDNTPQVVEHYQSLGLPVHYHRQPENIGPDRNFVFCFERARGSFFWLCGDDEFLLPDCLPTLLPLMQSRELDMVYVTSYGFRADPLAERIHDPLGRTVHIIADPLRFARIVNIAFTSISNIVVNRDRLLSLPSDLRVESPSAFFGTNLPQLGWSLPLLRQHRRSCVLWQRTMAGRQGANGGYSLARVFGERLSELLARLLPDRPDIARAILGFTTRRWFPSMILDIRRSGNQRFRMDEAGPILRRAFGRHPSFWIFTWPVLVLPLPLARIWERAGASVSKVISLILTPNIWRKRI